MEGTLLNSPKLGYPVDGDDTKYVSRLSTILVATIQEAKDRISQIEYVFCSQLYPNFQLKSKSLQKLYSEAMKESEEAFQKKENEFVLQIEKLQHEKQEAINENQLLKLEKERLSGELEDKTSSLLAKLSSQQIKINDLEQEVSKKSKEADMGKELAEKLIQLIETKASLITDKGKQLEENVEKTNTLLAKVKSSEERIEGLERELSKKTEEVAEKNKELKDSMKRIECLENDVNRLQEKLGQKTEEIEKGRLLQVQLLQQIDTNAVEILKRKQQLEETENDRKQLLDKVNSLEEKVIMLQKIPNGSNKVTERNDACEKLIQQNELKASELLNMKKSFRELMDRYKSLKSQYNFLLTKKGLTTENMLPQIKLEDESGLKHQENPTTSGQHETRSSDTAAASGVKVKIENETGYGLDNCKVHQPIPTSSFSSPPSIYVAPKCPQTVKSAPTIGTKRPASRWIETRSRQCKDGPDPHDDFLSTPLENIRENLNKNVNEEVSGNDVPVQEDMNLHCSDDETQDMNPVPSPEKQRIPAPRAEKRGFKYVEPVRKKAERENLKGVECKQCKKFYDAVLSDNGGKDAEGSKQVLRCEHHEGVSRHRYKYAPPLTPEGFWNIGFESEI